MRGAEVYEWQIAALLATAKLDEAAKRRIVAALSGSAVPADTRRIGRLEQELRSLALDNAFGRVGDDDYLRRKTTLTAEIEDARQPRPSPGSVDPARAIAWLEDLRSLWEVDLPEKPEHATVRREYELPARRGDSERVRPAGGPGAGHRRGQGRGRPAHRQVARPRAGPRAGGAVRGRRPR